MLLISNCFSKVFNCPVGTGSFHFKSFLEIDPRCWCRILKTHFTSFSWCCHFQSAFKACVFSTRSPLKHEHFERGSPKCTFMCVCIDFFSETVNWRYFNLWVGLLAQSNPTHFWVEFSLAMSPIIRKMQQEHEKKIQKHHFIRVGLCLICFRVQKPVEVSRSSLLLHLLFPSKTI